VKPEVYADWGALRFDAWGTIAVRSGRRGDTLVAPVIVSDRLFLSGLLASIARLRFTGWEPS
jgi:hypothetical protein